MKAFEYLNINELKNFLLDVGTILPVFVWGPPGIGKSSIINQFAKEVGLECVPLLGSQLAPEDLIGIPQIDGKVSRFIPPSMIVREKEFCLFIDELNIASPEIQKAFYSLILDKRIGEYNLPKGSIVIGAGNRSADSALVRQMPSALINRMIHVHLKVDHKIWLDWAKLEGVHPWVIEYIQNRPSHLSTDIAPTDETPFSTPRSWHYVSDALKALGENPNPKMLDVLLYGSLTNHHATQFKAFIKQINYRYAVPKLITGAEPWPKDPKDRDILLFLVNSAKDYLIKELPKNEDELTSQKKKMVVQVKDSLKNLSFIDGEYAQNIITPTESGETLPRWFLTDITKELPKLMMVKEKV